MSFQYINPYIIPSNIQASYSQYNLGAYPDVVQQQYPAFYMDNPIQASFYNQNLIYPYNNPNYQPSFLMQANLLNQAGLFNQAGVNNSKDYQYLTTIPSPTNESVHLFQLKNGQKVAIMPRKNQSTIVKTFLDAGSMNETDKIRGISHMEEHMLFKGSSKFNEGDVFRLTGLMGASTNASTDYAQTDYYITAPFFDEDNFQKVIEIQGDMISNPKNDAKALESEKGPVCSEISMCDDNIYSMALDRTVRNLFQIESDSHDLVAGSIETVRNLTSQDLQYHHATYYDPQDLYTVVIGDVDVLKTIDLISKNYTAQSTNNPKHYEKINPIQQPKREDIRSSKTNSTSVILGFAGPKPINSKDVVIADMINVYLSRVSTSQFKNTLDEINAEYDFSLKKVSLNDNDPYAMLSLISLNPNQEQEGIDAFYDAVIKLQNQDISDEDLMIVKKYIEKSKLLGMSDSSQLCDLLGTSLINGSPDLFSNYYNIANSITQEDIRNFAKKYFDLNKVALTVVHPSSVSVDEINKNYNNSKFSYMNSKTNSNNSNHINAVSQLSFGQKMNPLDNINTDSIQEYIMPNNTHLAIDKSKEDLCVYSWSVDTPPIKPKNPNIPLVLTYIFQNGSEYKNQNELQRYKDLNGIDAVVQAYGKSIDIYANCAPEDTQKTLDLVYELLYHPKLTQKDFEQAKKFVKDSLLASQKDAGSNLLDKIYPGYFPTKAAMLNSIDSLTLDDVKEFYNQLLASGSSSFCATLPLDKYPSLKQQTIDFHKNQPIKFSSQARKLTPIFKENPAANVIYDTDDLNQAQIYKSYQFPLSGNIEDEAKFEILNTILGADANARLFSDLRTKQNLCYSVYSKVRQFENTGVLTLGIQTTTDDKLAGVQSYDNVRKSLEGFDKHVELLCNELVTDEELESAKMSLKQNITAEFQDSISRNILVLMNMQEPYGIKRIDKYVEAIDRITKEDILKTAQFIFSYKPTVSILASEDTIKSQMDYLRTQGEVFAA